MELLQSALDLIMYLVDVVLHLDVHLNQLAAWAGVWLYVVLFVIIFCETGLVVTPLLPGDSLLFAVGALTAVDGAVINLPLITILLIVAAILGDAVNYSIGKYFGKRMVSMGDTRFFKQAHLLKTEAFYAKHGGKTIILARFLPIVRTFAPFVAGMGSMTYSRFAFFNVTGGVLWITSFTVLGHYFGNLPSVKSNFHLVILGIIVVSVLPLVFEVLKAKMGSNTVATRRDM